MAANTYAPGDRVWRWWDSGAFGHEVQPLTVVRVNQKTLTVRTRHGDQFRIEPRLIEGLYVEEGV
jgi:hypothetical protein